ncbi:MAG: ATP-dependent DNA helicase RecG [Candidatus Omnitrophica bacterium]|nr:ATP-dependent DNA helicase RecG [Candidatus Omnitrophota bacterium]
MKITLDTPLSEIPSVGDKRSKSLARLELNSVSDLLFFYPRRYLDLRNFKKISMLSPGETASVKGKVAAREEKALRGRTSYLNVALSDGTGVLFTVFFNQPYLKDTFALNREFFISGRVEEYKGRIQMVNPLYEEYRDGKRDWLLPVYPLSEGLTHKYIRRLIKLVMDRLAEYPEEILPLKNRLDLKLPNVKFALRNIHFPLSDMNLEKARNYLIFREFFILQMGLLLRKEKEQKKSKVCDTGINEGLIDVFESLLPFKLTKHQKKVMLEIVGDIKKGMVVSRMIHGEVGSGKTVVAVFALWLFSRTGVQTALLAPTEILAEQHYLNWQEFFLKQEIPVALLLGQFPEKEKNVTREGIKNGDIKVLMGTHALLTENLQFKNLGLAVVDEQHKFGVKQRELLKEKGKDVHYIVMSATPIPRSVALTFYGALDISTIGELPKGERRVLTYIFQNEEKERIYRFLEYQNSQGRQGYVVTPAIEGNENIKSAVDEYDKIKRDLPDVPCGLIHGRLPHKEKEEIMRRFREKKTGILVATSVIESGIDVPDASYIVIEQAERFGLAQLHQLRGRVGRSGDVGYCILVPESYDDGDVMNRLESFVAAESGFEIAEIDLELRGQGDLLGVRQHGIPPLKIGNIVRDMELLTIARSEAQEVVKKLPPEEIEKKFLKGVFTND